MPGADDFNDWGEDRIHETLENLSSFKEFCHTQAISLMFFIQKLGPVPEGLNAQAVETYLLTPVLPPLDATEKFLTEDILQGIVDTCYPTPSELETIAKKHPNPATMLAKIIKRPIHYRKKPATIRALSALFSLTFCEGWPQNEDALPLTKRCSELRMQAILRRLFLKTDPTQTFQEEARVAFARHYLLKNRTKKLPPLLLELIPSHILERLLCEIEDIEILSENPPPPSGDIESVTKRFRETVRTLPQPPRTKHPRSPLAQYLKTHGDPAQFINRILLTTTGGQLPLLSLHTPKNAEMC